MTDPMLGLALIVALAAIAQLLAVRTGVPQIVPLLLAGVLGGPQVFNLFDPDALLGDMLEPVVNLAVGVVLFDGAMQLRHEDLADGLWRPVVQLVTAGVVASWLLIGLAIQLLLGVSPPIAWLAGAVLTLSGPTVVAPLLHHIRPSRRIGTVLEWEGILIDPVGAIAAVITFQIVLAGERHVDHGFLTTVGLGIAVGVVAALLATPLLRARSVPLTTRITAVFAVVLLASAVADALAEDAGLVAAIVLGLGVSRSLRHLSDTDVHDFASFGGALVALTIGVLFVILSARVDLGAVAALGLGGGALIAFLVFVQRPLAVGIATLRTPLSMRERAFAAGLMPRGIVVASTASAFQISLVQAGVTDAELLVPICFLVIAATVLIYGLGGRGWALALGVGADDGEAPPAGGDSAESVRSAVEQTPYGHE